MTDVEELKIKIRDTVTEIYEELKSNSNDYRELRGKCVNYCRKISELDIDLGNFAIKIFEKKLEYETGKIKIKRE